MGQPQLEGETEDQGAMRATMSKWVWLGLGVPERGQAPEGSACHAEETLPGGLYCWKVSQQGKAPLGQFSGDHQ